MRISYWSSLVGSSDLRHDLVPAAALGARRRRPAVALDRQLLLAPPRDLVAPRHVLRRLAHRDVGRGKAFGEARMQQRVETGHGPPAHRFHAGTAEGLTGDELDGAGGPEVGRAWVTARGA